MPKVRMQDGTVIEFDAASLLDDNDQPIVIPTGPVFTAADLERVRSEEKDKLYTKIDSLTTTIDGLKEQVGGLTAEEQRRVAAAEEERTRLEAEARRQEEQGLDAATLVERARAEWEQSLNQKEQEWNSRFEQSEQARQQAEALAAREREYTDLQQYILGQVRANEDRIAPQLVQWITGNSKEEVDAAIARAIATTDAIAEEMQQALGQQQPGVQPPTVQTPGAPAPPQLPGTRVTFAPGEDPGVQFQQLTPEQINKMPMDQFAKLRSQIGIGGQSNNRGLFG